VPLATLNPDIPTERFANLRKAGTSLSKLKRGIEKEALRTTLDGRLSQEAHPAELGSPLTNSSITTDFSESQLELITRVHTSTKECLEELANIQAYVNKNIDEQLLWPHSMPCHINKNENIPLAQYGSTNWAQSKTIYRRGLSNRYGSLMQTISGIHYNFSISDECWLKLGFNDRDARTQGYFDLIRNFRRWSWLLIYLFGASPIIPKGLALSSNDSEMLELDEKTLYKPYATSLRMGPMGYQSEAQNAFSISYNSLAEYIKGMRTALTKNHQTYENIGLQKAGIYQQLNTSLLQIENEFYGSIRPKRVAAAGERQISALQNRGVEYIEVRCLDLDPYQSIGITESQIRFIDTFLIMCLLSESPPNTTEENELINLNQTNVVDRGRQDQLILKNPFEITLEAWANLLIKECKLVAEVLDEANDCCLYTDSVLIQDVKIKDSQQTPSAILLSHLKNSGQSFQDLGIQLALKHKDEQRSSLPPNISSKLHRQSLNSISKLKEMEQSREEPFEKFLEIYTSV